MASATATTDHNEIRRWVEKTGGSPAHVTSTSDGDDPGILRIDYPGYSGKQTLEPLEWDTWFEWFDKNELALLYQDQKDSRFNKLVSRESVDIDGSSEQPSSSGSAKPSGKPVVKASAPKKPSRFNAIKLLEKQHRDVEAAFTKFEQATTSRDRKRLFSKIADMLAAHTTIEEQYFYPQVFTDKTEDELREAVEEHLSVKRIIDDLLQMEPSDQQFTAKMKVMEELVNHHVEEEENELFKLVRKEGVADMSALGEQMEQEFKSLMRQSPRNQVPEETAEAAKL